MKLEFIFGVIMFAIVIVWVVSQINTSYTSIGSDSKNDVFRAKAYNLMAYLAEGSGDPGWESATDPKSIGLSYEGQPYNLSMSKIAELSSNCSLLDRYNLGAYRVRVDDSTGNLLSCGPKSVAQITISVTKNVYIEDHYGNMTVEVW